MTKIKTPANLKYSDILVGAQYSFKRKIEESDVFSFAKLTGDSNPLHVDSKFGEKSIFRQNIVHGMFIGSLFSTLVGMYCPGKNCLYLSQELSFIKPVFFGQTIIIRGIIKSKTDALKLISIETTALVEDKVVVKGLAKVKVLE